MSEDSKASVPEPAPQKKGFIVPDKLIIHLKDLLEGSNDDQYQRLINLIQQRDAFGRNKYGQPLMSEDGRDGCEDARQELGDLLQYTYKCKFSATFEEKELLKRDVECALELIKHFLS